MKRVNDDDSWEQELARYLRENPDYFQRHEDLLEVLRIPHVGHGAAASLLERQATVLRARLASKDREWQRFLSVARDNDIVMERLHRLAVALIDACTIDDVFGCVYDLARREWRLDAVVIALGIDGGPLAGRNEFVSPDDSPLRLALTLAPDKPLCGPTETLGEARALLRGQEAEIRSVALVPLHDPVRSGVLLLGSRDPDRFPVGVGTVYLSRLGELVMRAAAHQLNRP